jgi:hypothetical protein
MVVDVNIHGEESDADFTLQHLVIGAMADELDGKRSRVEQLIVLNVDPFGKLENCLVL